MRATETGVQRDGNRACFGQFSCWSSMVLVTAFAGVSAAPAGGQELPSPAPASAGASEESRNPRQPAVPANGNSRKSPAERDIRQILPFVDYLPVTGDDTDPCDYLCPRPLGPPCETSAANGTAPPPCPAEVSLEGRPYAERSFAELLYLWEASNLFSNPLYFEDPPLERYGHTHNHLVQPLVSAGRFSTQLIGLPYQMTIDPVCRKMYALGWYRPGECAPQKHYQIPLNAHAAAVQGGVVTGLFFLIP